MGNQLAINDGLHGLQPIYVLEYKYLVAMLECPVFKKIGPIKRGYEEEAA